MRSVRIDMFLPENSYWKNNGKICWDFNPDFFDEPNYEQLVYSKKINAHRLIDIDRQMSENLKEEDTSIVNVDWI